MLKVKNISKDFGSFKMKGVNFEVDKGDYFVLLGVSGSGKSILLEIIAGLIKADEGRLLLNNQDITNKKIQQREVGLVFQDHAIFPHLNVKENIAYSLKSKRIKKSEINKIVTQLAEEMEISNLLNRSTKSLSGGEKQRVALARTLALNPQILLLDEPLASLDVQLKNDLNRLLRNINRKGQTIIHVTHDYEEAISLANKVAVLNDGEIVQCGDPAYVFQHPKSSFIANFIGIKNYFKTKITDDNGSGLKRAFINETVTLSILINETDVNGFILIRSEDIIISKNRLNSSACNNFEGVVNDIIITKTGIEVITDIGIKLAALISKRSLEKFEIKEGSKVWLSFKASALKFLKS